METVNQPSPRCASFQNTAVLLAKNCVSLILQYAVGKRGFVFRGYDAACTGEDFLPTLRAIRQRFADIIAQLQLQVDLTADFETIASHLRMISTKGTAAHIFHIIADANINIRMIDQSSNELNIIIAISETEYELAVQSLYHAVERAM